MVPEREIAVVALAVDVTGDCATDGDESRAGRDWNEEPMRHDAAEQLVETRPGVVDWENRLTTIVSGVAEGHLVGGNLSLMVTLLGTPFEPQFEGAILFLEDVGEPPYSVDRMLTHLWMAGKLEQLAGIVLGKFTDDGYDRNTFSMEEVLRNRLEPLGIPTLRGAMIGHVEDKTVVPLGVRARLDADAGALTLLESAVS